MERAELRAGCNNVALTYAPGTMTSVVAQNIEPRGAVDAMRRYDNATGRFVGWSPIAPESVNDYREVGARLEPVFV